MIERKIAAGDARSEFATLINEVAFGKTRAILTRHGKNIAAIVPMQDVDLIKRFEDEIDSGKLAARQNEKASPMHEVGARLGLKTKSRPSR